MIDIGLLCRNFVFIQHIYISHMNTRLAAYALLLLITGCTSARRQLMRGDYDSVIDRSVRALLRSPNDEKQARMLDKAYTLANERDLERVRYLKIEKNPNTWEEVFRRYESLKSRQAKVKRVVPIQLDGSPVTYELTDYDRLIVEAKSNAAEFYNNNARKLLLQNDRFAAREAYSQLLKAREYSGGAYQGLNELIVEAQKKGITNVLITIENQTRLKLSPEFEKELLTFDTRRLNTDWVYYHVQHIDQSIAYNYLVIINLNDILLTPDQTKENDVVFKKEVPDGFAYVLDSKGNVKKDSLGNDMKVTKYKTLAATLIEKVQHKEVIIKGMVEFVELKPQERILAREPITAQNVFHHVSARAIGDLEALDDEARKKIKNQVLPFPGDLQMLQNCTETLKPAIAGAITQNRKLLQ